MSKPECRGEHAFRVARLPLLGLMGALSACGGGDGQWVTVENATARCAALAGKSIPSKMFALPTGGATITTSALVPQDAVSGRGEYCKVNGQVTAKLASDLPIKFQVNLPSTWNTKALQYGGGGFNGTLITAEGGFQHAPENTPTPIARGYFTYGSDGGTTPDGSFGLNAQALVNYGGESVKKTRDVSVAIASGYYETRPTRTYYIGGSKGGHEGLVAVQRYAKDYDGVVAYYPANQNQAMVHSWDRMWRSAYETPGSALDFSKTALLRSKVLEVCDALDGATDGIVANVKKCGQSFSIQKLRCPEGVDSGETCLSDAQIGTLTTAATPMQFAFPLANGVTSMGSYPVFSGGDVDGILFDGTSTGLATAYNFFNAAVIKNFVLQDPDASTIGFDYRDWQTRVQEISSLYDATNPNIDAFKNRGGKLFIVQGTTDMLVTPETTTAYVDRLSSRYHGKLKDFVRYYVQPGFGHGNGVFALRWDALTTLEDWVERGEAPQRQVSSDANVATAGRTRPLCEYPSWPLYKGKGDVNNADNFKCTSR